MDDYPAVVVATAFCYNTLRVGYKEYLPKISRKQMSFGQKDDSTTRDPAAHAFGAFWSFVAGRAGQVRAKGNPVPNRAYEVNLVKMAWSLFCMFLLFYTAEGLTARLVQDDGVR